MTTKTEIAKLEEILNSATAELAHVSAKKMFGCHALMAKGNIFALVWKHGRLGVKLPDESVYRTLMEKPGSEPWKAGPMKMAHWVLLPATYHSKSAEVKKWTAKAHELCSVLEKKSTKKSPTKKK